MVLLLDILTVCSHVGDKALVFSQSIPTLDLIEFYLSRLPRHGKRGKFWRKGKDWYRWVYIAIKLSSLITQGFLVLGQSYWYGHDVVCNCKVHFDIPNRLDGRTESSERQKLVENFNDPVNKRVKCALISTRAGSLGINLHAANRVVIVDGSWNPTYDLQAIYRAWRLAFDWCLFLLRRFKYQQKLIELFSNSSGMARKSQCLLIDWWHMELWKKKSTSVR